MLAALIGTTIICYFSAITIERHRIDGHSTAWLISIVGALILYLCFFKIKGLLGGSLLVPLGVSYYTFRLISYLIDVHWGKIKAERNFLNFAAYVAFFPHLIAGPIQRADDFLPQIHFKRQLVSPSFFRGITRIMLGLFKKLVVADQLALLTNYGFLHAGESSSVPSMLAFYLFPLQLFMDFAALTDIAIGVGLLFGIESPENFDRPFTAPNISEFWRRWHMSLTGWLRDYVFMPVRMSLRDWGNIGLAFSLTINMMLIAFWHGFRLSFLTFGLIHSFFIIIDVFSLPYRKRYYKNHLIAAQLAAFFGPIFTYHIVALANVFFRASTFSEGYRLLGGLFTGVENFGESLFRVSVDDRAWISLPLAGLAILGDWGIKRLPASLSLIQRRWIRWAVFVNTSFVCFFILMLLAAGNHESSPFLYENF